MGLSLKSIGKGLKKVGSGLSKAASFVPVPIGMVGSVANAAINKRNIGKAVVGDLGRNSKIAATLLPMALSGGMAGGALSSVAAGGGAGAAAANGAASRGLMGGIGSGLKSIGKFALQNPDLLMAGLSGLEGYKSDKRADALRKQQQQLAMANWNQTMPLRTMGQSQMLDQSLEQLPYAINRQNPFAG